MDVMDVLEALYPGYQLIKFDHSAGNAKYREDELHVEHEREVRGQA